MFNILSYFKRADGARKKSTEQKTRKEESHIFMISDLVKVAAKGVSSSTADNYKTAVRSFIRFNGGKDAPLSVLNVDTIREYERWLHEQGICPNTSSCYMRSLRAIYNKVAKRTLHKEPFRLSFTGNDKTVKRSIGLEEVRKLQAIKFPEKAQRTEGSWPELVRDLFLFSFYAMGMPFADMARLKRSQIKEGVLTYCRQKTGKQVRVKLEKCMLDILAKYQTDDSDYLFPVWYATVGDRSRPISYSSMLNRYNRSLKRLAIKAGIRGKLTSYVPRHSWASIAYKKNIDLPIISKALGHTDTKTTLIYISEIDDKRLAKANRKLLYALSCTPLGKRWISALNFPQD